MLPFENLSGIPENAYFAEGIQEEILTRLAKIADLKVIPRTSTTRYRSSPDNLRDIAKQLGVTNILEGSVQKVSDQVRVNVQLINALSDAHLWAESFDRKLTDIFAVESDIATTIAETLQAKLTGSEKTAIAKRPTANTEAYELYLKGRFFWNKRTGADLRTAIGYFDQALGKDPSYALAYAGLADSYGLLNVYGAASPADSQPQAKAAAKKAVELDDTLAEAHASSGRILSGYDFAFDRATREFERALQLNPNYATARHWISAGPLTALARFDRAIGEGSRAVDLDPLSLINNTDLGWVYFAARRYDEAIAQMRKTIEIDSHFYLAHYYLGQALQLNGQLAEAIAEYRKAVELDDAGRSARSAPAATACFAANPHIGTWKLECCPFARGGIASGEANKKKTKCRKRKREKEAGAALTFRLPHSISRSWISYRSTESLFSRVNQQQLFHSDLAPHQ